MPIGPAAAPPAAEAAKAADGAKSTESPAASTAQVCGGDALTVHVDGHCARKADAKGVAGSRHVMIRDLAKIATALKQRLPWDLAQAGQNGLPCSLLMIFEGSPMATEHCAKGFHAKLLKRLTKLADGKKKQTEAEVKKAVAGSLQDLDAELRDKMPGLEGCGAAVAFFAGKTLCLAVAGPSGATLWGRSKAAGPAAAVSKIGEDGFLRKEKQDSEAAKREKALLSVRAKQQGRRVGGGDAPAAGAAGRMAGAGAAARPGAGRPGAAGAAANAALALDEVRTEVVDLVQPDHMLLLLGSGGLYGGCADAAEVIRRPQELAAAAAIASGGADGVASAGESLAAGRCGGTDAAAACTAASRMAHEKLLAMGKGDAGWVKNEKLGAQEAACVAAILVWPPADATNGSGAAAEEPSAKKAKLE
eukprot:TRINITY_DN14045_c0_g1_i1.p1 TRINITY_DN14045_c0_g1~~TRINITY_DN14045_c0_g1_i1.p1  ORF type:complete len:439 (+),score=124.14 TRINITY_DN14045_c0_g1_i1:62-1318(+)